MAKLDLKALLEQARGILDDNIRYRGRFAVAALYVDPDGPYKGLVREFYDESRDATTYDGDLPVVAHPPCGPWGKLAWRCKNQDKEAGRHAIRVVRRVGGVVEHPVGSKLFADMGIETAPWTPDRAVDARGGYTIKIRQWDQGHRALKDTILYIVGTDVLPMGLAMAREGGEPMPVEHMTKLERRLTPSGLAYNLALLASMTTPPKERGSLISWPSSI